MFSAFSVYDSGFQHLRLPFDSLDSIGYDFVKSGLPALLGVNLSCVLNDTADRFGV